MSDPKETSPVVSTEPPAETPPQASAAPPDTTPEPPAAPLLEAAPEPSEARPLVSVVQLPSMGYLYGGVMPEGKLEVSAMTTQEEKILAGGASSGTSKLSILIKRCCKLPKGLTAGQLLVVDRQYLLLMIRALSYGADYQFRVKCEECDTKFPYVLNLISGLPLERYAEQCSEPFKVDLPHSGDTIEFRLLRGDDEELIAKETKQRFQRSSEVGDPGYITRLALHIVTIEGEERNRVDKEIYIRKMYAPDSLAFRNQIDEDTPGISPDLGIECPRCGEDIEMGLPLTAEFFRPKSR